MFRSPEEQARREVAGALTAPPLRHTRCQVVTAEEEAMAGWPEDMPPEAARFEAEGWSMAFELAPRCADRGCCICHG